MKRKKSWYDYLWIVSLIYLALGFFNILFAWLGLICFIVPLLIAIVKGNKSYCNKYCGRSQLFDLIGGFFWLIPPKKSARVFKVKMVPVWFPDLFYDHVYLNDCCHLSGIFRRNA